MSYHRKNRVIDSVPPDMLTTNDVIRLLHLTHGSSLRARRYDHLYREPVSYQGCRQVLYRKAEIEAMLYTMPPQGYITNRQAAAIFNLHPGSRLKDILHRMRVPCLRIKAHHPYDVWPEDDVRHAATAYHKQQNKHKKSS